MTHFIIYIYENHQKIPNSTTTEKPLTLPSIALPLTTNLALLPTPALQNTIPLPTHPQATLQLPTPHTSLPAPPFPIPSLNNCPSKINPYTHIKPPFPPTLWTPHPIHPKPQTHNSHPIQALHKPIIIPQYIYLHTQHHKPAPAHPIPTIAHPLPTLFLQTSQKSCPVSIQHGVSPNTPPLTTYHTPQTQNETSSSTHRATIKAQEWNTGWHRGSSTMILICTANCAILSPELRFANQT